MTSHAPSPAGGEAGTKPALSARAAFAAWRYRQALRWPRLVVLRLELVLAWALSTSALALFLPPLTMGTPQHPRNPTAYMQGFFLPSSLCCIVWALWQWYRRPALPRHAALGLSWSPFVSLVVVVVLQSAVLVSARVANATAAGLRDKALVEQDLAYYRECAGMGMYDDLMPKENGRFVLDHPALTRLVAHRALHLPWPAKSAEACLARDALLDVYVSADEWQEMAACVEHAPKVGACATVWSNACEQELFGDNPTCQMPTLGSKITSHLGIVARAHHLPDRFCFAEDPPLWKAASFVVLVVAFSASCAGVTSLTTTGGTLFALYVLGVAMTGLRDVARALTGRSASQIRDAWFVVAAAGYLLFSLALVAILAHRRQRSPRMDVAVLSALLGPIFVLHVLSGIFKIEDRNEWIWLLEHHAWGCSAAVFVSIVAGALLSAYRRLPSSS